MLKFLVVEDRHDHRLMFGDVLQEIGYKKQQVTYATSKVEALELLRREFFHVCIVDCRLVETEKDNYDGIDVVAKVAALSEGSRVIFASAHADLQNAGDLIGDFPEVVSRIVNKSFVDSHPEEFKKHIQTAAHEAEDQYGRYQDKEGALVGLTAGILAPQTGILVWTSHASSHLAAKGGFMSLRTFMKTYFRDLHPFKSLVVEPEAVIDREERVITAQLWSKMCGKALHFRFGPEEVMSREVERARQEEARLQNRFGKVLRTTSKTKWAGVIYEGRNLGRSHFE